MRGVTPHEGVVPELGLTGVRRRTHLLEVAMTHLRRSLGNRALAVTAAGLMGVVGFGAPALAAAPANDEVGGAVALSLGDHVTLDTTEATTTADDTALNANCGA